MARYEDSYKAKGRMTVTDGKGKAVLSGTGSPVTSQSFRAAPTAAPSKSKGGGKAKASSAPKSLSYGPSERNGKRKPLSAGPSGREGKRRVPTPDVMSQAPSQPSHSPSFSIAYPESGFRDMKPRKRSPSMAPASSGSESYKAKDSNPRRPTTWKQFLGGASRDLGLGGPLKSKRPKARP